MVYNKEKIKLRYEICFRKVERGIQQKGRIDMAALHFTKDNFEQEVLKSDVPVLVDFWATWCGPCQMVLPIIEELADELQGLQIGKVNVDEEMELAKQYRVMSIPTLIVFKNGEKAEMSVGAKSKEEIKAMLGV